MLLARLLACTEGMSVFEIFIGEDATRSNEITRILVHRNRMKRQSVSSAERSRSCGTHVM